MSPALPRLAASILAVAAVVAPVAALKQNPPSTTNRASLERLVAERSAARSSERAALERWAAERGIPLVQELTDGTVIALERFDGRGKPVFYITDNLNAARTVSTDDVWSGGSAGLALDGSGVLLGIWDGGNVRATHQELTGRVTNLDGVGNSDHSTHVAGTMIATGVSPTRRGMANAATLRGRDFNDDETEMAAEQLLPTPVVISNHSYGFISGWRNGSDFGCGGISYWFGDVDVSLDEDVQFGLYGESSAMWDQIAFDAPGYLMVKSSGNDRGESGTQANHAHLDGAISLDEFQCLQNDAHPADGAIGLGFDTIGGGAGSAKNNLTIGAVNDIVGGWTQPSDVVESSFHGKGPVDDGRIKPDLVANGVSLSSSSSSGDASYVSFSGTSMSTPNVSGSLALLRQHADGVARGVSGSYRASTFKALVIHTADEAGANPGPDYSFGWGLLNTRSAAALLSLEAETAQQIYEFPIADGGSFRLPLMPTPGQPLRATLVWTDPPGAAQDGTVLDPAGPNLVNDLDMTISGPTNTPIAEFAPWVLDPALPANAATTGDNDRDNVEQVVTISPLPCGDYVLDVLPHGTITNGPQVASLIVSGNRPGLWIDDFETGEATCWSQVVD